METNQRIAAQLRQIADILDYQGVAFKPVAYRRAAQTIESLPQDVSVMKPEEIDELPGIGQAIAAKIAEYLQTGNISFLAKLLSEVGPSVSELMRVDDLGPKRVKQLNQIGVFTVAELIQAAKDGKLRTIPRFSELLEKKILENAGQVTERSKRFPWKEIEKDVSTLVETIRAVPGVERAEAAGSFRRRKETVGDVDIIVVPSSKNKKIDQDSALKIEEKIEKLPIVKKVVAKGPTRMAFNIGEGLRVDIRFVSADQWGTALLYFTGDKEHNIALRRRAIERDWKLNEYSLSDTKTGKVIASKEEKDIYKALELPYIEPEKRLGQAW